MSCNHCSGLNSEFLERAPCSLDELVIANAALTERVSQLEKDNVQLGKNVQFWVEESFRWGKKSREDRAESDQVDGYHGCLSGDCPHETQPECDLDIAAHRFAVHWSKPSPPQEAIDALDHAFKQGVAWHRARVLSAISYPCECGYSDELRKESSDDRNKDG